MTGLTTKERVEKLEGEISSINTKLDAITELIKVELIKQQQSIPSNFPLNPAITCSGFDGDPKGTFRKPVMYFYNMTGDSKTMSVDFGNLKIPDSIPEVRDDGKIVFNVDQDSFINGKYKYLYYEIELEKDLPKPAHITHISNDKTLEDGLKNVAILMGLWSNEVSDFVSYWDLELKRSDCKYWKCDIYTEKELNPLLPIKVYPEPDYFIRRYVVFSESDKGTKVNTKLSKSVNISTPHRTGAVRVVEWGGMITGSGTII